MINIEKEKYWIKAGTAVSHRDYPHRKMVVDNVVMRSSPDKQDPSRQRKFIVGVDCHWLTDTGEYGKGRFLTMELQPFDSERQSGFEKHMMSEKGIVDQYEGLLESRKKQDKKEVNENTGA